MNGTTKRKIGCYAILSGWHIWPLPWEVRLVLSQYYIISFLITVQSECCKELRKDKTLSRSPAYLRVSTTNSLGELAHHFYKLLMTASVISALPCIHFPQNNLPEPHKSLSWCSELYMIVCSQFSNYFFERSRPCLSVCVWVCVSSRVRARLYKGHLYQNAIPWILILIHNFVQPFFY